MFGLIVKRSLLFIVLLSDASTFTVLGRDDAASGEPMDDVVSKRAKFGVDEPGNESEATNFGDQDQVKESSMEKDNGSQVDGGNHQEQSRRDAWKEIKDFLNLQPPEFDGKDDLVQAEEWVLSMENIFKFIQCSESRKVLYATYRLTMDAQDWWMTTKMWKFPNDDMITWASFKEVFESRYMPDYKRDMKRQEFLELKQNSMTVFQYSTRYNHLESYCGLKLDEKVRADRFVEGLNRWLRTKMIASNYGTLDDAVSRASHLEYCLKQIRDDKQQTRASSWRGNGQDNCTRSYQPQGAPQWRQHQQ